MNDMRVLKQLRGGFTIVEVIIVVTVIAILASITVVSYNGVQQRARDTKTAAAIETYKEALNTYYAFKRSYPTVTGPVCLGRGYTNGKCWLANVNESAAFMDALETYTGALPKLEQGVYLTGGQFVPAANNTTLDGVATNFIAYIVAKSGKCPYGPVATYVSGQAFSSTVPASGQSVAPNSGGDVQCWIALEK